MQKQQFSPIKSFNQVIDKLNLPDLFSSLESVLTSWKL